MGTYFDYNRVRSEIEELKTLCSNVTSKNDAFLNSVVDPMHNPEVWSGQRHDVNLAVVEQIKNLYEEEIEQIRSQIDYLEYIYENYKKTDNTAVKTIEEWKNERLGGAN